ncbi:MAG: hypothetical protein APR63_14900 [Desulfuromonas sp. SDB]|nr:MAG: hypothetical protein APR63_14900 [Desulfuromonas sp. SDB]
MKKQITNLPASIHARLLNKAREMNRTYSEVLQYYGMERFLYRFSCSKYREKFILKGALLFTALQVPNRRMTLDIDFLSHYDNQVERIETVIKEICNISVEPDGLIFDSKTVRGQRIKENANYEGVRIKFSGFLERSKIPMQIDIGFNDTIYPKVQLIDYPTILDFQKPHLYGYPIESVISEKFEAMIILGLLNSRMKDFYDIWILIRQFDFEGLIFSIALRKTFTKRMTALPEKKPIFAEQIYNEYSEGQAIWKTFLKKANLDNAPEKLVTVAKEIEYFLIEPLTALHKGIEFNKKWIAPGPWK